MMSDNLFDIRVFHSGTSDFKDLKVGDLITFNTRYKCTSKSSNNFEIKMIPVAYKLKGELPGTKSWLLGLHLLSNTNRYNRIINCNDIFVVIALYNCNIILPYWLPRSVLTCLFEGQLYNIMEDQTLTIIRII